MVSCSGCGNGINGSYTTFNGRPYHPQCFKCSSCSVSLANTRFFILNGSVVCGGCQSNSGPKCLKCQKPFASGVQYKVLPEGFYHNECFTCAGPCQNQLPGMFYTVRNKRICSDCYQRYGDNFEQYVRKDESESETEETEPEPEKPKPIKPTIRVPIYY